MGKIKTRETERNVKTIDKAAIGGERMKNAFIRSKNSTENLVDDRQVTPGEYAEDKVMYATEDISHDAAHLAGSGIKTAANKGKEALQRHCAEKAAEKLRGNSSEAEPSVAEQASPSELTNGQTDTKNASAAEQPKATDTEQSFSPQASPALQEDQPISAENNGTTLYPEIDRMVEQIRSLVKKKAEQKAEVSKQIQQQTGKIAHQPERAVKTDNVASGFRHTGETVRAGERPAQSVRKSVRGIRSSARGAEKSVRTVEQSTRSIKQTAKPTGRATTKTAKGTIKTSPRAVKTAQQTSKAAIKTAQATAKAAQKTTQATVKTARVASAGAKTITKAVAAADKAIVAGSKALITVIAAGGSVAVLAVVIICMIGLIVGSCFGIFFSGEDTGSNQTMYEVVREINADYDSQLERIKQAYVYDDLEMSGSRAVWKEVLAVYAVKTTTDPDNAQGVTSIDDGKKALLKEIFWSMNAISVKTETFQRTEYLDAVDANGNIVKEQTTITKTVLYITANHKSAEEMAVEYGFSTDQKDQLTALLAKENDSLWCVILCEIDA